MLLRYTGPDECSVCRKAVSPGALICPKCGAETVRAAYNRLRFRVTVLTIVGAIISGYLLTLPAW
jgi:predicted amidophosphoribosyltransferase